MGKCLYVTHLDKCWKITQGCCEEVPATSIQHEEAHGRLLLQAALASREGIEAVVICADDTDVFILCLAFRDKIHASLFEYCGSQTCIRLIDISNVAASVGSDVCKALLGLHACTICDILSAFAGKGKIRGLTILKANAEFKEPFAQLGVQWNLPPNLHVKLEEFVCKLCATKPATSSIDAFRCNLFCARKGDAESHQLPPCQGCLRKDTIHTNYQAAIWRRSLISDPETPDPVGMGGNSRSNN